MTSARQKRSKKKYQFFSEISSVFLAGCFSKTVVAPIERVKLLLQNQVLVHSLEKSPYKGIFNTIKSNIEY